MLLFVASTVIFIYGMLASMLGTIIPSLAVQLSLSNVEISYLALAQGVGLAVTSVGAGALMDRSGKKIGILLGLMASICGLLTLANAKSLVVCIIAMAVLGIGGSLVIVGANVLANDVSPERRGTALNVLNLFVGLGGLATPFVAGNLLEGNPTKIAYTGAAISAFALCLALATRMERGASRSVRSVASANVFADPTLYILSLITFFYTACEFAMWNWLPKYLIAAGMPSAIALNILSLGFACGLLVGRIIAARVLVRASPYWTTLASAALVGVSSLVMLNITGTYAVATAVFFVGLSMAPIFPTTIAIVGGRFDHRAATAIGFAITCGFSGLVVSSPVIGWIAGSSSHGLTRALYIIPVLQAVIICILLALNSIPAPSRFAESSS